MAARNRLKKYFFRGLAVLLPSMLTIWVFIWGFNFIQSNISVYINAALVWGIERIPYIFPRWSHESLTDFWVHGAGALAGFVIALLAVIIVGALLASVVGRSLWRLIETLILRTPFLKNVYPYVKQVTDFIFSDSGQDKLAFSRVVAIEYPRKGIWSIGMVTGTGIKQVAEHCGEDFLAVFVPTSPTPFTGFVMMVQKDQVLDVNMTIDQAFRYTISGGVITPEYKSFKVVIDQHKNEVDKQDESDKQ